MESIQQNGWSIQDVKNPTLEMKQASVCQNEYIIHWYPNPSKSLRAASNVIFDEDYFNSETIDILAKRMKETLIWFRLNRNLTSEEYVSLKSHTDKLLSQPYTDARFPLDSEYYNLLSKVNIIRS